MDYRRFCWVVVVVFGVVCAGVAQERVDAQHSVAAIEKDRFHGWPANNGAWQWGDEFLVGFTQGELAERQGHNIAGIQRSKFARSLDGGVTWQMFDPENFLDGNDEKSFVLGAHYKRGNSLTVSGSYFGGVERPGGAPEGRAWRHGLEAWAQWSVTEALAIAADGSGGFEDTTFGRHWWSSAAAYARLEALSWLFFAARGDRLWEDTAGNAQGGSTSFLIPTKHVTSGTATVDVRPVKGLSTRLELKHDVARDPLYFRGDASNDAPNARSQTTLLLGATAWM